MQHHRLRIQDITLHVVTDGPSDGPSVVLLHGFPEFWYGWRKQIPALAQAGFRVIVPDQRGYNLSDKPRGVAAYDIEALVRDVIGVFDHFGLERARLVGHDWGATVAWTVAIQAPERLEKLVILNVPHPDIMIHFLLRDPIQRRKSWYIFLFQLPFLPEWLLSRNDFRALAKILVQSGRRNTFYEADLMEYKRAWAQPRALTAMLNWYRAAFHRALRGRWSPNRRPSRPVRVPTRMLWGKHDIALNIEMARPSIELCERGDLIVFPEATHWVQHDAADEVNRHLIEFLG